MKKEFKMPTKSDLKSRSSTISNAFAISITPYLKPNNSELESYYTELEIEKGQCGYCMRKGEGKTVDHINPLVKDGMPSGFITDINNLIPCCKDCNSKKGGKSFQDWYKDKSNILRLKQLGLTDQEIEKRYEIVSKYIALHCPVPFSYSEIVGPEKWAEYKQRRANLLALLVENQKFCDELNKTIADHIKKERHGNEK